MNFSIQYEVPYFESENGAVGQLSMILYIRNKKTGQTFALNYLLFDNRGDYTTVIMHDGDVPFVSASLVRGEGYFNMTEQSETFTHTAAVGLKTVEFEITEDNLNVCLDGINRFACQNRQANYCGEDFSKDLSEYEYCGVGVLNEIAQVHGAQSNAKMGVHFKKTSYARLN
jgi:hypothetical protein